MSTPLRVLIIEDSENDAILLVRELKRGGYDVTYERIDTLEGMDAALGKVPWDIVISDYVLPKFSGLLALKYMQSRGIDLPFIMVSGKIAEEAAVEAMKAGAGDYITKGNLTRLVPAVARELRDALVRLERHLAEEKLHASEAKFRRLIQANIIGIFVAELGGNILEANDAFLRLLGYTREDMRCGRIDLKKLSSAKYRSLDSANRKKLLTSGELAPFEKEYIRKDGSLLPVIVGCAMIEKTDPPSHVTFVLDLTERKDVERRERDAESQKREFYRRTILAATAGKLMISDREEIEALAGPPIETWEVTRGEDLGLIRCAVDEVVRKIGMDESRMDDFILCTGEAITNAYKHASNSKATIHHVGDNIIFVATDSGPGIDALALPEVALTRGYTTAVSLGMGYKTMLMLADQIYLATGPEGTTIAVEMKLHPVTEPALTAGLLDSWKCMF